jgi:serine/threonine-protein kinase
MGVTLYEILSGKMHYNASGIVEILTKVVNEDPIPLREQMPGLPEDLNTIVMKCLEKDRNRRYDSARALADDLRRFLEGEPVLARPLSEGQRLLRKAKKHRALVITSMVATLLVAIFAGIGLQARWNAQRQAIYAQQLGQEVKEMETVYRLASISPAHDMTSDKKQLRQRMERVRSDLIAMGDIGAGPGSYALARGHLALGEYEMAHDFGKRAWDAGYQAPEVAYTLALSLGKIYQQELEEAETIRNKLLREQRI